MKYSVNIRQPHEILEQADEIYCSYAKDIDGLFDIAEKYPYKHIVIRVYPEDNVD